MPTRFRCCFCNHLLGIASRKAGTVIDCPICHGKIWVPGSPTSPGPAPGSPGADAEYDVEPVGLPGAPFPPAGRLSTTAQVLLLLGVLAALAAVCGLVVWLARAT